MVLIKLKERYSLWVGEQWHFMSAVYKKMIAVIKTIIASPFYRNPYQTSIKKAVRKRCFANCFVYINVSFDMFCPHY